MLGNAVLIDLEDSFYVFGRTVQENDGLLYIDDIQDATPTIH